MHFLSKGELTLSQKRHTHRIHLQTALHGPVEEHPTQPFACSDGSFALPTCKCLWEVLTKVILMIGLLSQRCQTMAVMYILGVYSSSAVAQLRDDMTAVYSFGKFM